MNKMLEEKKKGFTLIEVVLVLAIAGLIILIVFLALPALQRSQRDTQRRTDMSRFTSQISQYQSNNQGNVPTSANLADFVTRYMFADGDQFNDPNSGDAYVVRSEASKNDAQRPADPGTINYYTNAKCNGESVTDGDGNRNVAIITKLEGGAYYCQDNS